MPGRDITSIFICIVTLTWLSVGVDLGILMRVLDTKREIAVEGEIRLLNSMVSEPLCLTSTRIDEG